MDLDCLWEESQGGSMSYGVPYLLDKWEPREYEEDLETVKSLEAILQSLEVECKGQNG